MTQRERFEIARAKNDAFYQYLLYCYESKTVPDKNELNVIDICQDAEALKAIALKYISLIANLY